MTGRKVSLSKAKPGGISSVLPHLAAFPRDPNSHCALVAWGLQSITSLCLLCPVLLFAQPSSSSSASSLSSGYSSLLFSLQYPNILSHCIPSDLSKDPSPHGPPEEPSWRSSPVLTVSVQLQLAGTGPLGLLSSGHHSHPCPVDIMNPVKIQLTHPGASAVSPAGTCLGPVQGSAQGESGYRLKYRKSHLT